MSGPTTKPIDLVLKPCKLNWVHYDSRALNVIHAHFDHDLALPSSARSWLNCVAISSAATARIAATAS